MSMIYQRRREGADPKILTKGVRGATITEIDPATLSERAKAHGHGYVFVDGYHDALCRVSVPGSSGWHLVANGPGDCREWWRG
ncbi:MAG: hypothetical protein ABIJ75_10265 [Actinomycetota bacterium]